MGVLLLLLALFSEITKSRNRCIVVLILISIPMMIPFESIHEAVPAVRPCAPSSGDRPHSAHGGSLCKLEPVPTGMGFYTESAESRRSAIHHSYFQVREFF